MLKDIAPKARRSATRNARALRRKMTLPEVFLWQALRRNPSGLKFRRQHPTGPYVLDFFCGDARLAVEVDGEAHSRGDRPKRDDHRDAWLREAGIDTLRVRAADVLSDLDAVLRYIVSEATSRLPLHHPAGGPPPRD
ncbi:endonuclease domain-containing protein [Sphingomonas flavescens]|uniref:endonuclease domain-containing protein n=1 Tax=Sphingomonas flavescens TaxID=3132797 RepID=UPI002805B38E|nr:endonuclease domain-containing protein [Sphingomonas limnosediminicola]